MQYVRGQDKDRVSWPFPYVPPGRLIMSDCGSESYRVAEFIGFFLNLLSTRHVRYLKDRYNFLQKIRDVRIRKDAKLFSMDIDSLYMNIEKQRGLAVVKRCFKKYPDRERPDGAILRLLELSLTKNDFELSGWYFLQIKGIAMGKKFAPAYANINMAEWEETMYWRSLDDDDDDDVRKKSLWIF